MKFLIQYISILLLWLAVGSCDEQDDLSCVSDFCNADTEGLGSLQGEPGLIVHHDSLDIYYILYSQMPTLGIGLVCNLPPKYQVDSLEVVFDARVSRAPDATALQLAIFGSLTLNRQVRCLELQDISVVD